MDLTPSPKGFIGLNDLFKSAEKFAIFLLPQIVANQSVISGFLTANVHLSAQFVAGFLSLAVYLAQQVGKWDAISSPVATPSVPDAPVAQA